MFKVFRVTIKGAFGLVDIKGGPINGEETSLQE